VQIEIESVMFRMFVHFCLLCVCVKGGGRESETDTERDRDR